MQPLKKLYRIGQVMHTTVRRGAVIALLSLFAACGSSGPTSPTGPNQPSALPSPTPAPATHFPPLSGPSRTFSFDRALSYSVSDYTKKSRLVLYDNGAFVLQYPSLGEGGIAEGTKAPTASWPSSGRAGASPAHGARSAPSKVMR